ncbi:MAG: DUF2220 family protein [Propionibacteriaceae bacterium]|nr:DUF2220 family protein [Propionibacteriaceae bacterium]
MPPDLRDWARKKYDNQRQRLLVGSETEFRFSLQPPSEADALNAPDTVTAWVKAWHDEHLPAEVSARWVERQWPRLGVQLLPICIQVKNRDALANLAGRAAEWRQYQWVAGRIADNWGIIDARLSVAVAKLSTENVDRLLDAVQWFVDNPDSGKLVREVPLPGVDTKWLERHRSLVRKLYQAVTGSEDLGLLDASRQFTVRTLDKTLAVESPLELAATPTELNRLTWHPSAVVVCENLACVKRLPLMPETVAVHGGGYACSQLAMVGWLREAARVFYWGDMDVDGLRILGEFRKAVPRAESVLMNTELFEQFVRYAVKDPKPYRGMIGYLTSSELQLLRTLRNGDWRLEQERIDLSLVAEVFRKVI